MSLFDFCVQSAPRHVTPFIHHQLVSFSRPCQLNIKTCTVANVQAKVHGSEYSNLAPWSMLVPNVSKTSRISSLSSALTISKDFWRMCKLVRALCLALCIFQQTCVDLASLPGHVSCMRSSLLPWEGVLFFLCRPYPNSFHEPTSVYHDHAFVLISLGFWIPTAVARTCVDRGCNANQHSHTHALQTNSQKSRSLSSRRPSRYSIRCDSLSWKCAWACKMKLVPVSWLFFFHDKEYFCEISSLTRMEMAPSPPRSWAQLCGP